MKTCFKFYLLLFILPFVISCKDEEAPIPEPIPEPTEVAAFPGVQGAGMYTTGGRGGYVYSVTSLEDNPLTPGTLRYALSQYGNKIIVFNVAGIIQLTGSLVIGSNVTILGQSAPGDGICIKDYPVLIEGDNVIIRFLRFRLGNNGPSEGDALTCIGRKNIIIDHCSMSWSTDECASCYDNENFTMQYCIISESLRNSSHSKGAHGYGGIWGGKNASFHHNLLAHHDSRNPRFCGSRYTNRPDLEKVDFRNNVIYNWKGNSGYAGEGGSYNIINNYYKPGPATLSTSNVARIFQPYDDDGSNAQTAGVWGAFYVNGNYFDNTCSVLTPTHLSLIAATNTDNWTGIHPSPISKDKNELKSTSPFSILNSNSQVTQTALDAYTNVLAKAGASLVRDGIDARIVGEVQNGNYTYVGSVDGLFGIIDTQEDVGGWPSYTYSSVLADTDRDGMPNDWEDANGLNKNSSSDGKAKTIDPNAQLTNVEMYLNSLVNHLY